LVAGGVTEILTLRAGGQNYAGWTEMRFGRGLERCASDFDIAVTDRWAGTVPPILPFTPVQLLIGDDVALTGVTDDYSPRFDATMHEVRVTGRSRTGQLVDCTPLVPSGQFSGYRFAAVCRAVAQIFGLTADVQTVLADVILPDATYQPCETAFEFLDRLAAVAGVILTDEPSGNLLVTTAGGTKSGTALVQGVNILSAEATISGAERFSMYVVKGQAGLCVGLGASGAKTPGEAQVLTGQAAQVSDASVPLYRPKVFMADSTTGQNPLQVQAQWQMNHAIGKSATATIVVKGYRQNDGTLWQPNLMVAVTSPFLGINGDLLITAVEYGVSKDAGESTTLRVAPVQAADPNPKAARIFKHGHKGKQIANWDGAGGY
jgi:prophage tail gpP-like protein